MKISSLLGATCIGILGLWATTSNSVNAAVVVNVFETLGGDVRFEMQAGSSLDLTGLSTTTNTSILPGVIPGLGVFDVGQTETANAANLYFNALTGPTSFGTGGSSNASSASGGPFTVALGTRLALAQDYISGTPFSDSIFTQYDGATFASLGITPGTYVWTVPSGDTITLQSVTLPMAVPLPAAAWLFGSGLLGLVGIARRKKAV